MTCLASWKAGLVDRVAFVWSRRRSGARVHGLGRGAGRAVLCYVAFDD